MTRSRRRLAALLTVLTLLLLAATGALAVYLQGVRSDLKTEEADRVAVVQAAQRFTESWNTFSADEAQKYVDRVAPLLSTKFRKEFTDASADVITGIEQQGLSSTGTVLVDEDGIPLVGIASMDPDSAEVLVVSDAERVAGGQSVVRHWRWQLSMVKVGGRWLVDGFDEV